MSRTARAGALAAAVLCLATAAPAMAAPASDGPTADAAGRCRLSIGEQRNLGPTYVISLSTRGVSCRTAKRVVRAYHSCRFSAAATAAAAAACCATAAARPAPSGSAPSSTRA